MSPRSITVAAALFSLLTVLVACGSDGENDAALTTSETAPRQATPKPKPYTQPRGNNGTGETALMPVGASKSASASATARTVRFQTTYAYGSSLYLLPTTNVFVYRGTSASGTPIQRTSNSSGIATFTLTAGTRYTIKARKVRGSCPPARYIYYEPRPWALTVPSVPPNFYRLVLSWQRVC